MSSLKETRAKADNAKDAAQDAESKAVQAQVDEEAKAETQRVKAATSASTKADNANTKNQQKLDGELGDSERKKVIVTRKFSEHKHKIFVSTVITKNGKPELEQFRVPVDVEVELPVEIIAALKKRGVAKFDGKKQSIVNEFVVETV